MNFDCNEFYKVIADTQNINYNPLKEIRVTNEFYECVIAKCRTEIISENTPQGLIGKFTGNDVPACGFSIGFERIILLLMESGFKIPESPKRVAYLVEKKYPAEKLVDVMKQAKEARENGQQVLVVRMNKNKKFQKEQLSKEGYEEFVEFFNK